MAKKQTSIFGSFLVTCIGAITLGLLGLYFGYYEKRIQYYQTTIADLQSRPTPEISLTFTVTQEEGASPTSKTISEEVVAKEKTQSQTGKDKSEQKGETASDQTLNEKTASRSRPVRTRPNGSEKSLEQKDELVTRGPAFPRTRQTKSEYQEMEEASDIETRRIPDIDDPEMDDNPLIRALREASRRQADNPQRDDDQPPSNPFEAILNIQDN